MIYVWAAIAIVILFLIWQIIRWWNLPATIAAREKSAAARAERWRTRPRLLPRNRPQPIEKPVEPIDPNKNYVEIKPTPDPVPREGLRGWLRNRRNRNK